MSQKTVKSVQRNKRLQFANAKAMLANAKAQFGTEKVEPNTLFGYGTIPFGKMRRHNGIRSATGMKHIKPGGYTYSAIKTLAIDNNYAVVAYWTTVEIFYTTEEQRDKARELAKEFMHKAAAERGLKPGKISYSRIVDSTHNYAHAETARYYGK